jgi:GT2 family glycosyltransferase
VSDPRVSIVVVSWNAREHLLACLSALAARVTLPHEVVVVDNASADGSAAAVRARFPAVTLIENADNPGFSRANNQGFRATRAPYVLVLNPDAEAAPGAVEAMAALLDARSEVGVVGPRTRYPDGRIQVSFGPAPAPRAEWAQRRLVRGVRRGDPLWLAHAEAAAAREHEPAWVSASCLMARRTALDAVSGFDEGFFLYQEDVDLCLRVRKAGWRIVFTPAAEAVHHLGASMSRTPAEAALAYHRSHLRLYRKHAGLLSRAVLRAGLLARGIAARSPALLHLALRGR